MAVRQKEEKGYDEKEVDQGQDHQCFLRGVPWDFDLTTRAGGMPV